MLAATEPTDIFGVKLTIVSTIDWVPQLAVVWYQSLGTVIV